MRICPLIQRMIASSNARMANVVRPRRMAGLPAPRFQSGESPSCFIVRACYPIYGYTCRCLGVRIGRRFAGIESITYNDKKLPSISLNGKSEIGGVQPHSR